MILNYYHQFPLAYVFPVYCNDLSIFYSHIFENRVLTVYSLGSLPLILTKVLFRAPMSSILHHRGPAF